jgi:hypothetical protein
MNLETLAMAPGTVRHTSLEQKDGYYFDIQWGLWMEGDEFFRERIKQESLLKGARRSNGLLN